MSDGLRIDIPVSPPTISIKMILSGLVKSTFRSIFIAAALMTSLLDMFVKRFSTVMRKVSFFWISAESFVAILSISFRSVRVTS